MKLASSRITFSSPFINNQLYFSLLSSTGDSRYVDFGYLDTITYVEVIFHSQHFFSIYLCFSTPSMSKTVNMKQRAKQALIIDDFRMYKQCAVSDISKFNSPGLLSCKLKFHIHEIGE